MKQNLKVALAAAALSASIFGAQAASTEIFRLTFDDAESPVIAAPARGNLEYTHTSVISNTPFLNYWGENNNNYPAIINLTEDLSAYSNWTLEFEWAGYAGCNKKAGYSALKAGDVTLFRIDDKADWNSTMTLTAGELTQELSVYPCNKANRISAATGDALNTVENWHHFTVAANDGAMTLTITLGDSVVVDAAPISAEALSPTALELQSGSCGAVAVDELFISVVSGGASWSEVSFLSFDDAESPVIAHEGRGTLEYTHTSVVTGTPFVNFWGENNSNAVATVSLNEDLSAYDEWKMEFYWAGYGGCNKKAGATTLMAGESVLFAINDVADWNSTMNLVVGDSTTAIAIYPCNKSNRISAATGDALNDSAYWHLFTINAGKDGMTLTVTNVKSGENVVENLPVSAEKVNPTALNFYAGSCGAVALDALKVSVLSGGVSWSNVAKFTFDDAETPVMTTPARGNLDYSHTSVISGTTFLNYWGENNNNYDTELAFNQDLSIFNDWSVEFDWAGYGGCNKKAGATTIMAGETVLFAINDIADWNSTMDLVVGDQTIAIPVYPCNKSNRISAATGDALNDSAYWHHFVIKSSADGVLLTVTNYKTGEALFENLVVTTEALYPTALKMHAGSCGAVAIDELSIDGASSSDILFSPEIAIVSFEKYNPVVKVSTKSPGATLYYAVALADLFTDVNGQDSIVAQPFSEFMKYEGLITLEHDAIIQAYAEKGGKQTSIVESPLLQMAPAVSAPALTFVSDVDGLKTFTVTNTVMRKVPLAYDFVVTTPDGQATTIATGIEPRGTAQFTVESSVAGWITVQTLCGDLDPSALTYRYVDSRDSYTEPYAGIGNGATIPATAGDIEFADCALVAGEYPTKEVAVAGVQYFHKAVHANYNGMVVPFAFTPGVSVATDATGKALVYGEDYKMYKFADVTAATPVAAAAKLLTAENGNAEACFIPEGTGVTRYTKIYVVVAEHLIGSEIILQSDKGLAFTVTQASVAKPGTTYRVIGNQQYQNFELPYDAYVLNEEGTTLECVAAGTVLAPFQIAIQIKDATVGSTIELGSNTLTGIEAVETKAEAQAAFDLQGRAAGKDAKGLLIQGNKVIFK